MSSGRLTYFLNSAKSLVGKSVDIAFEYAANVLGTTTRDEEPSPWDSSLYRLQISVSKPIVIPCKKKIDKPKFFGEEYHGDIGDARAKALFNGAPDGSYMVRQSSQGVNFYALVMKFDGEVENYRLFYRIPNGSVIGKFTIEENPNAELYKEYDSVEKLVLDGLIKRTFEKCRHMDIDKLEEEVAEKANYQNSPHAKYLKSVIGSQDSSQVLQHQFTKHTFVFNHCDYCTQFLWGKSLQGLRCASCGVSVHRKCSLKMPHNCRPDDSYVKRVFSVDLTTWCLAHNTDIPDIVQKCISQVVHRGTDIQFIYRQPGRQTDVAALVAKFEKKEKVNLKNEHIDVVASLLKKYFRELPKPLIPPEVHSALELAPYSHKEQKDTAITMMRDALMTLSIPNRATLKVMIVHLKELIAFLKPQYGSGAPTSQSFSTLFTPAFFGIPADDINEINKKRNILTFMIDNPAITDIRSPTRNNPMEIEQIEEDNAPNNATMPPGTIYIPVQNFYG